MSDVAQLIADLVAAAVPPELVGRVAEALAQKPANGGKRRQTPGYSADFEAFWKSYPTDQNMSKKEASDVWAKLPNEERELAMKAVEPFKQWIKAQPEGYRTIHACRFLSKKRFEGHAGAQLRLVSSQPSGVYVLRDSAEWSKYAEAYKAQRGKYPPVDKKGGWFFQEASNAG